MHEPKLTRESLAVRVDHAALKPELTRNELRAACELVARLRTASICVQPCNVAPAKAMLAGSGVMVGTVAGFPLGATTPRAKAAETRQAVLDGADEIDMVLNIGRLIDGDVGYVERDIAAVVAAADGRCVKVILECCCLTDEQKIAGCKAAVAAGAKFVKTSTGTASGGATVEDVRLLRNTVGSAAGVKAAGGIRTLADVEAMIAAGATRLGCSATEAILDELSA